MRPQTGLKLLWPLTMEN